MGRERCLTMLAPPIRLSPINGTNHRTPILTASAARKGFSLMEVLVTMVVLLIISGGIFSAISSTQQSYARTELKSDMYENVQGAAELLGQEVGQAGLVSLPASTISS